MSSKPPTLAVVIATYNYAHFLPDALDSILAQQPAFDEVVVVNDGSTDNTLEVLKSYADQIVLLDRENEGQVGACLAGLEACSSDYIYFLDADDFAAAGLVAAILPALAGKPVKVQFQLEGVDGEKNPLGSTFPTYPSGYDSQAMQVDNQQIGFYQCPPTSGNIFHRETMRSLNLNPKSGPAYIDATAPLVMPYLGEVVSLSQPLAHYRMHGAGQEHSTYARPTVASLQKEIATFRLTWNEAVRILDLQSPPYGKRTPLYVLEREMMRAALENRFWMGGIVFAFLWRLLFTRLPLRSRLMLVGWSTAMLMPLASLRASLVQQRRSPGDRPRLVSVVANWVLHPRKMLSRRTVTPVAR